MSTGPSPTDGVRAISPNGSVLRLEQATTTEDQERGFMDRGEIPADGGMLFVFPSEVRSGFWMVNTPRPLSVAFLAADCTILDIRDMEPFSDTIHRPEMPYRIAIETNQGWFRQHHVAVGDRLQIHPRIW